MTSGGISQTRTYLTFTLDQEDYAVDVAGVREVLDFTSVTRVPRTPHFMKGVINLRGSVVPVVDMRLKFGLPESEKTVDTCIIVLEVEMDNEITVIGAIADSVKEVFELESGEIEPPPRMGTRSRTEFISGMGKYNDEFIIILDVNKVFTMEEFELFRHTEDTGGDSPSVGEGESAAAAKEKTADNRPGGDKESGAPEPKAVGTETAGTVKGSRGSIASTSKPAGGTKTGSRKKTGRPAKGKK